MAIFNLDNYLATDGLGFPLNFRRGNPNPLDNSSVWKTLDAAKNYAETDPTAYVGQILSVIEVDENNAITSVMAYMIEDEAGTLKEVGSVPTGDNLTIEVIDGVIQIKGFGKQYYKYIAATEEDEAHYELTEGFIDGLEPKIVEVDGDLVIGWYEPNPTTVEGLDTKITTVEENITTIKTDIANVETDVSNLTTVVESKANAEDVYSKEEVETAVADAKKAGTDAQVTANTNANEIATLKETVQNLVDNPYDDTEVRGLISDNTEAIDLVEADIKVIKDDYLTSENESAIKEYADDAAATAKQEAIDAIIGEAGIDAKYDTLKEVADWILADTTNSAELITRVTNIENDYLKNADKVALQGEIDALETFVGALPEGAVSTTVVAYIQEAIDALKIGDYAKVEALNALALRVQATEEKLTGIEAGAEVNIIAGASDEFTIADRVLAIKGLDQTKITGLTNVAGNTTTIADLFNTKVDKVEGSRLLTSDEAAKLEKLVMDETGNVGISGTISAENVVGLNTLLDTKVDKVEGMGLSANNLTNELVDKINNISAGAQVNIIDAVSDEFVVAEDGKVLNINAVAMDKVTGLTDALSGKVDVVEGKGLSSNDLTDELVTKINESQANIIEIVKINNVALAIDENKAVNIPVAGADLGVVKTSDEENKVAIAEDGTMEVNTVNVNKLVQNEGEFLILDGGSAQQ